MKCYCCGKDINKDDEILTGWHKRCVKSFFGTKEMPLISLDDKIIEELASQTVNQGLTVPGVQKKLSLHLDNTDFHARFTLVGYPTGYILKPQSDDYKQLPEAEYLVMSMARNIGISVVPFGLINVNSKFAYITKRVDRINDKKLAMEDFCQLSGRPTADKYKGSYEECGKIIRKYSNRTGIDISEFFLRLVFCNVIGNSDMHLKNFSLIESESGSREYILSAAYDLLPVNIILPSDKDFSALTMNGKKRNLRKKDFLLLAENIGLSEKSAINIINKVINSKDKFVGLIQESYVSDEFKQNLIELMESRIELMR